VTKLNVLYKIWSNLELSDFFSILHSTYSSQCSGIRCPALTMFYLAGRKKDPVPSPVCPMQSSNLKIAYGHASAIKSGTTIIIIWGIVIIFMRCTDPDVRFVPFPAFWYAFVFFFYFLLLLCFFLYSFFFVAKCWVRDRFVIINMIDEPATLRHWSKISNSQGILYIFFFVNFKRWISGGKRGKNNG